MVERRVKKFIKFLIKFMKKNRVNVAISAHGNSIRLFRKISEKAGIKRIVYGISLVINILDTLFN